MIIPLLKGLGLTLARVFFETHYDSISGKETTSQFTLERNPVF